MKLEITKNIQFTRLVKSNGRLHEFNFRKYSPQKEILFAVDVVDDRGNRVIFKMQKESDYWKISEPVPAPWISEKESQLHQLIEEEMLKYTPKAVTDEII
jgi:hypothetical protein